MLDHGHDAAVFGGAALTLLMGVASAGLVAVRVSQSATPRP
jgi:hypothetical protein